MSCPKCGGFVIYGATPVAVGEPAHGGAWFYYDAQCEDCDWTGFGRWWFEQTENDYEDDVELPGAGMSKHKKGRL